MSLRKKKYLLRSDASVLFIFIALVGTIILAASVIKLNSPRRISIDGNLSDAVLRQVDRISPSESGELLGYIFIESAAVPTMVLVNCQNDELITSLVQWDILSEKFVSRSSLSSRVGLPDIKLIHLKSVQAGWDSGQILELRVSTTGSQTQLVSFLQVQDTHLRRISIIGPIGLSQQDYFEFGETLTGSVGFNIEDLDDDGVTEVKLIATDQKGGKVVSVFKWTGIELFYDENWSMALTVREDLFPEPLIEIGE
jgi:hypothetical protein